VIDGFGVRPDRHAPSLAVCAHLGKGQRPLSLVTKEALGNLGKLILADAALDQVLLRPLGLGAADAHGRSKGTCEGIRRSWTLN
jgi:hypothetical protein